MPNTPSLQELEKKLYETKKPTLAPEKEEIFFGPTNPISPESQEVNNLSYFGRKRLFWWLIGIVLVIFVLALFIFWRGFFAFTKGKVVLNIEAPEKIIGGDEVEWRVKITNNNKNDIKDAKMIFQFPPNSFDTENERLLTRKSISIGTLGSKETREEIFLARVIGGDGFERKAEVLFNFRPDGSSLVLQRVEEHVLVIEKFPVSLSIEAPKETLSGQSIPVFFRIKNESDKAFKNLRLRLEYPSGFRFDDSGENLSEFNTIWSIGEILPKEERQLKIVGTVSGIDGEGKIFRAFLEQRELSSWKVYKELSSRSDLALSPLSLSIRLAEEIGGAVSLGDKLSYEITWRNNFDIPLTGLTLSVKLEGELFNLSSLRTNGNFDSQKSTINWSEAQVSSFRILKPGESGVLTFKINSKKSFSQNSSNPKFLLSAKITSQTKPEGLTVDKLSIESTHETRINGLLEISSQIFYNDPISSPSNSGPYPLRVGQSTSLTVHWKVASFANDFVDVRIKAVLPSGVSWLGSSVIRNTSGEVVYDAFSREVSITINKIDVNQGLISRQPDIVFRISIVPSPSQEGRVINLLSETVITAEDNFTASRVNVIAPKLDSTLPNDPAGTNKNGRVLP